MQAPISHHVLPNTRNFNQHLEHKLYFDEIAKRLSIRDENDWYRVTNDEVIRFGGGGILVHYNNSHITALKSLYPTVPWKPWKFTPAPRGLWTDLEMHSRFFDWLGNELGVKKLEDWYKVTREDVVKHGGGVLLSQHYNNSHTQALCCVYKEFAWQPWRFVQIPNNYWHCMEHRRVYCDWLAEMLDIKRIEDWFEITKDDITCHDGSTLLSVYNNCCAHLLMGVYSDTQWHPWQFRYVAQWLWNTKSNHAKFFDWLANQLEIGTHGSWYRITAHDLEKAGGGGLLRLYDYSLYAALSTVYPESIWYPWKFVELPEQYWKDKALHGQFLHYLKAQLNIDEPLDWYRVTLEEVALHGGSELLRNYYNNSLMRALKEVSIHVEWPRREWLMCHRLFFDWLEFYLGFTTQDCWYEVSITQALHHGGKEVLKQHNDSLFAALCAAYPERTWQPWKFGTVPKGYWEEIDHQKQYFDWLANELGISCPDGWYNVNKEAIHNRFGGSMMTLYDNSVGKALINVYPHVLWQPWRFADVSASVWADTRLHRQFFDWLKEELHIDSVEKWYALKSDDICRYGGSKLLEYYQNSYSIALQTVFPEIKWHLWKFQDAAYNHVDNQREFFDWLGKRLDVSTPNDWYTISLNAINRQISSTQLPYNHNSLPRALASAYPEVIWQPWRFKHVPESFFHSTENQLRFLQWVERELSLISSVGWYRVTRKQIIDLGGETLMKLNDNSLLKALEHVGISVDCPISSVYENPFDYVRNYLGIAHQEDWYLVSKDDVKHNGCREALKMAGDRLYLALQHAYPKLTWLPWKFKDLESEYWNDVDHQRNFFDYVQEELGLHYSMDWYDVMPVQVLKLGGKGLLKTNTLLQLLEKVYPVVDWQPKRFKYLESSLDPAHKQDPQDSQKILTSQLQHVANGTELECNATVNFVKYSRSQHCMQFDVWVPSMNLAIEYQGQQHYKDLHLMHTSHQDLVEQYQKDAEKHNTCEMLGIELIAVPYWRNSDTDSLRQLFEQNRWNVK